MQLDQPKLQWAFNLVMITGTTSLAAFCYMLRRANKQLTSELDHQRGLGRSPANHDGGTLGSRLDTPKEPSPNERLTGQQDIREFIAHRSREWGVASTARKCAKFEAPA